MKPDDMPATPTCPVCGKPNAEHSLACDPRNASTPAPEPPWLVALDKATTQFYADHNNAPVTFAFQCGARWAKEHGGLCAASIAREWRAKVERLSTQLAQCNAERDFQLRRAALKREALHAQLTAAHVALAAAQPILKARLVASELRDPPSYDEAQAALDLVAAALAPDPVRVGVPGTPDAPAPTPPADAPEPPWVVAARKIVARTDSVSCRGPNLVEIIQQACREHAAALAQENGELRKDRDAFMKLAHERRLQGDALAQERDEARQQYGTLVVASDELRATVASLTADRDRASALLAEVMRWHANPKSSDYNECDTDPCAWCEQAKAALSSAPDAPKEPPWIEAAKLTVLPFLGPGPTFTKVVEAIRLACEAHVASVTASLAAERDRLQRARAECERQFQVKVEKVVALMDECDALRAQLTAAHAALAAAQPILKARLAASELRDPPSYDEAQAALDLVAAALASSP